MKEKLKSLGLIILFGFGPMGLMVACSPKTSIPLQYPVDPVEQKAQEIKPEIVKYRISHNKILWDVILEDGSRCAVVSNGGLYCEFVK